jgi:hypothetical protein
MKKFSQFFNGFAAVTERVLLFRRHFGKGPVKSLGKEDRIVSEPFCTPWFMADAAPGIAEKYPGPAIGICQGKAADELGGTLFGWYVLKVIQ